MSKLKKATLAGYPGKGYAEISLSDSSKKSCNGIIYFEQDPGNLEGKNIFSGPVYENKIEHHLKFDVIVHSINMSSSGIVAEFTAANNPFDSGTQKNKSKK